MRSLATFLAFFLVLFAAAWSAPSRAATPSCPIGASHSAVIPVKKRPSARWERALDARKDVNEAPDLMLIGDSLMEQWDSYVGPQMTGFDVLNMAVSGDKTNHSLWRLENIPFDIRDPKTVAILIGTNNLSTDSYACDIANGIQAVADTARRHWPQSRIVIFSIPPRGKNYESYDTVRITVNDLVSHYVEGMDNATFIQLDDAHFRCGKQTKTDCGNYQKDRLHLSEDGYRILASRLQKTINDLQ